MRKRRIEATIQGSKKIQLHEWTNRKAEAKWQNSVKTTRKELNVSRSRTSLQNGPTIDWSVHLQLRRWDKTFFDEPDGHTDGPS